MMWSLLSYLLLTAADPAAAAAPAAAKASGGVPAVGDRRSGSVIYTDVADSEPAMAIDELGMPVDKKGQTAKGDPPVPHDWDGDGAAACRAAAAAACAANPKAIVDTCGGHGAHGAKPIAISESGIATGPKKPAAAVVPASSSASSSSWTGSCPVPAGMAINEKGVAAEPKKKLKSTK